VSIFRNVSKSDVSAFVRAVDAAEGPAVAVPMGGYPWCVLLQTQIKAG
jgi:hypothetical protein